MSSQRDRQFPATSIGRSSGARVQLPQPEAHDTAHPLLSPATGPTTATSNTATSTTTGGDGAPKYLPYTPRQRVVAAATTTGTIVHPPPSPQNQGNATTKLQLMHLKAAAQNLGLDTSTIGWAILEKLIAFHEGEEWYEIWTLITSGKATLLLPLEQHSNANLSSEFIKDHIVIWEGSTFVTSSGLRGVLDGEILTLRSTISPTSKLFQDLSSPITRSSAFSLLPPLPNVPESAPYPRFTITSECTTLPLPPRTQSSQKPALPPRPGGRSASGTTTGSRIPNPFASLFGSKPVSPNNLPSSPPASIRSFDSSQDNSNPIDISAFTIDRKITRNEVAKEINKALKSEIKHALSSASPAKNTFPTPSWVVDRIYDFSIDWFPFVRVRSKGRNSDTADGHRYQVNTLEESSDDAADRVQDFLMLLEQDLRAAGTPFVHRSSRGSESEADVEKEREKREQEGLQVEARVRELMELVERTISSLFYERLFMQPTTDDASHDETLTSRIAALNMLDLTLGHLDVIVGDNGPDVEVVVKACGEMLSQIDPCRCPADKAAILVAAHKVVVDGLSRLPPIRLKTDGDQEEDPKTARPPNVQSQPQLPIVDVTSPSNDEPQSSPIQEPKPSPLSINTTNLPDAVAAKTTTEKEKTPETSPHSTENEKKKPPHLTLEISNHRPKEPTPVSGDVLLPMLIFSVVKANPPRLLSNLLFTQRFRNHNIGGEESYCLINLMAVAEFLENVDLEALGLGDAGKVLSAADLTPIPLARSPVTSETPLSQGESGAAGLRGRVEQQVDAIADSANKVISGVVDSSFGILRSFLPNQGAASQAGSSRPPTPGATSDAGVSSSWKSPKGNFGLLRKESGGLGGGGGFSLASITASLPGRSRSNTANAEELGQQLVRVSSRASSVRSRSSRTGSLKIRVDGESSGDESGSGSESESVTTTTTDDDEDEDDEAERRGRQSGSEDDSDDGARSTRSVDGRSIKSFESMLASSSRGTKQRKRKLRAKESRGELPSAAPIPISGNASSTGTSTRKSLSDRLAKVSNLALSVKGSPQDSRSNSLLLQPPSGPPTARRLGESPASSRSPSPVLRSPPHLRLAPPINKFVDCNPGDLRLSEIGELLRDYKRLVDGIRSVNGFEE